MENGSSIEPYPIVVVPVTGIGENYFLSLIQSTEYLDGVHRALPELDLNPIGVDAVALEPEQGNRGSRLAERRPANIQDVFQSLDLNRAIDAEVRSDAAWEFTKK